jgi:hypothetical protein
MATTFFNSAASGRQASRIENENEHDWRSSSKGPHLTLTLALTLSSPSTKNKPLWQSFAYLPSNASNSS